MNTRILLVEFGTDDCLVWDFTVDELLSNMKTGLCHNFLYEKLEFMKKYRKAKKRWFHMIIQIYRTNSQLVWQAINRKADIWKLCKDKLTLWENRISWFISQRKYWHPISKFKRSIQRTIKEEENLSQLYSITVKQEWLSQ